MWHTSLADFHAAEVVWRWVAWCRPFVFYAAEVVWLDVPLCHFLDPGIVTIWVRIVTISNVLVN